MKTGEKIHTVAAIAKCRTDLPHKALTVFTRTTTVTIDDIAESIRRERTTVSKSIRTSPFKSVITKEIKYPAYSGS